GSTMMSQINAPNVNYVQIDSLVVMKIVKHVDSELYAGMSEIAGEACQGLLTGLVAVEDGRLEITNCFPTARAEPTLDSDEGANQASQQHEEIKQAEMIDMLRKFRNMNIDYELVGFYQAHPFGACFNQEMAESLFDYQSSVNDGVVLIYDPVKTRQGQLSFSAFRLSMPALQLFHKGDWTPESVKAAGITYENMFEELPVVIKNSHLVNVMVAELALSPALRTNEKLGGAHLELGTKRSLEKCIRSMMINIDEMNKSIQAFSKYQLDKQKHDANVNAQMQKREIENEGRRARGEPALSMDDIRKMKGPVLGTRNGMLDALLTSLDAQSLCDFATKVTGENVAKLFLAEGLAEMKSSKA
ncbi:hypothetical protein PFISCL1PPCAC_22355, partial [Pristionchus fissidentatus]